MTSKRPWKVIYDTYLERKFVSSIVDVDGNRIIETDMGTYGPEPDDAELIVDAVNSYKDTIKKLP